MINNKTIVLLLLLVFSNIINAQVNIGKGVKHTEKLVFFDDFLKLDTAVWKHAITMTGGGNWEFQQYVNNRTTSWVDNGVLYLKPMTTEAYLGTDITANGAAIDLWGLEAPDYCTGNFQWGCYRTSFPGHILNPITSARIRTAESFSFKYGRVEIRAKLPVGDWIWPAIWLMPRWNRYGTWPASGEIDIMESRGNKIYTQYNQEGGVETYGATMHWGPYWGANGWGLTHKIYGLKNGRNFGDDWHTFGLFWDKDRITFYVDDPTTVVFDLPFDISFWERAKRGNLGWDKMSFYNPWVGRPNNAPFDQEFFLIMNNAVGGQNGFFADNIPNKPWKNSSPSCFGDFWAGKSQWLPSWVGNDTALRVDWVKIWVFPDISTYSFNNQTMISGIISPPNTIAVPWWVYVVGFSALLLSIFASVLGIVSVSILIGKRVEKQKKMKKGVGVPRDQPMAGGIELRPVEETRRTTIST